MTGQDRHGYEQWRPDLRSFSLSHRVSASIARRAQLRTVWCEPQTMVMNIHTGMDIDQTGQARAPPLFSQYNVLRIDGPFN